MLYREFKGKKLSMLGFGAMRLPVLNGKEEQIDEAQTAAILDCAIKGGVNYFDTAYGYHYGRSETVIGRLLAEYPRESYYLASKFPGYDLDNMDKVEQIFEEQLQKCGVEYFDFYLLHNVCELNIDAYLEPRYNIVPYLLKQREAGRIKHLGFSAHGAEPVIKRLLEAYSDCMEFGQLQVNYLDMDFHKLRPRLQLLQKYGIPLWIMEPIRGGMLASLKPELMSRLTALRPNDSAVAWAFRYVQGLPQTVTVLSGMSTIAQVEENIAIFSEDKPLSEAERQELHSVAAAILRDKIAPCTACRYCTAYCPQGLDIPSLLSFYNEHSFSGGGFRAPMFLASLPKDKQPSACIACHSCEAVCPQQLQIADLLADFNELLK